MADSLKSYLERHAELERRITRNSSVKYFTTENPDRFKESASVFMHEDITVEHIELGAKCD